MKQIIRDQIAYINKQMKPKLYSNNTVRPAVNNISIHTGKLSDEQIREFKKVFNIVREEVFGYTYFQK